jgi:hypothetical protein
MDAYCVCVVCVELGCEWRKWVDWLETGKWVKSGAYLTTTTLMFSLVQSIIHSSQRMTCELSKTYKIGVVQVKMDFWFFFNIIPCCTVQSIKLHYLEIRIGFLIFAYNLILDSCAYVDIAIHSSSPCLLIYVQYMYVYIVQRVSER